MKEQKQKEVVYECKVCRYIYEGELPFEEVDEDYLCPLCNRPKSAFVKKEETE